MMRYIIALCLLLTPASSMAEITVDDLYGKYRVIYETWCTDNATGREGVCTTFDAGFGFYLLFCEDGVPVFIRFMKPPNPYVEVWRAPRGVAL